MLPAEIRCPEIIARLFLLREMLTEYAHAAERKAELADRKKSANPRRRTRAMTNDNTPQESGKPFAELPQVPRFPRFPRFPDIHVELTGKDGNAFAILGRVARALREAGVDQAVIDGYLAVMSGDYANLLKVSEETVDVSFF